MPRVDCNCWGNGWWSWNCAWLLVIWETTEGFLKITSHWHRGLISTHTEARWSSHTCLSGHASVVSGSSTFTMAFGPSDCSAQQAKTIHNSRRRGGGEINLPWVHQPFNHFRTDTLTPTDSPYTTHSFQVRSEMKAWTGSAKTSPRKLSGDRKVEQSQGERRKHDWNEKVSCSQNFFQPPQFLAPQLS